MKVDRRCLLIAAAAAAGGVARADLSALIQATRASVLPVGTYSATDSPRFVFRGTGFVVAAAGSAASPSTTSTLVATCRHVLPEGPEGDLPRRIAVLAQSAAAAREAGDMRLAEVVASDRQHDLALLRIEGAALPALRLASAGAAREGQAVALIGYPVGGALGFAPVTHRGIVASITTVALPAPSASQLDPRAVSRLRAGNFEVLQLDATAYPGNSGGPLFDAESAQVVGVVNMVMVRGSRESALSAPTGITYAIPVARLLALLAELR